MKDRHVLSHASLTHLWRDALTFFTNSSFPLMAAGRLLLRPHCKILQKSRIGFMSFGQASSCIKPLWLGVWKHQPVDAAAVRSSVFKKYHSVVS